MELQRIIWSWDMITRRLREKEREIGRAIFRSCRPIADQRYRDGRLIVVLGCWWPADQEQLNKEANRLRLNAALGEMLTDKVVTAIVRWPGGTARSLPENADNEGIPPPDVLGDLPEALREEAAKCESAVQRLFFSRAYVRGFQLRCQYPLLNYRLDFALPEKRLGAEVMGWDWRTGASGAFERRARQEELEANGWRILFFSGSQVLADPEKCVAELTKAGQAAFAPGQGPLPTRYSPVARKPYTSLGTYRRPDRDHRKPQS